MSDEAMTVTFAVTSLERIEGHGRLLALVALEVEFDGVALALQGVQVVRRGKGIATQAPRFRHPKSGTWTPAVILPDELGRAIAQEVQSILQRGFGGTADGVSRAEFYGTPLDRLIEDSITKT